MFLLDVTILLILMSHPYRRKPRASINSHGRVTVAFSLLLVGQPSRSFSKLPLKRLRASVFPEPAQQRLHHAFGSLGQSDRLLSTKGSLGRDLTEKQHFTLSDEHTQTERCKQNSQTESAKSGSIFLTRG